VKLRKPSTPAVTLAYCETSSATVFSPHHVRVVGPEGLKTGGGAPGAALCGRDLRNGWDLRETTATELASDRVGPDRNHPGHTCRGCRDAALALVEREAAE
jgi:hypothetical protein